MTGSSGHYKRAIDASIAAFMADRVAVGGQWLVAAFMAAYQEHARATGARASDPDKALRVIAKSTGSRRCVVRGVWLIVGIHDRDA